MAPRRELLPLPPDATYVDRLRFPVAKEAMNMMPGSRETFEERQIRLGEKRVKYAGMIAHQEMSALVLAAGGTFRLAAAKAGVSVRQVKKYYTEVDFRTRIEELRTTMLSKVRGRVLKELDNRTKPGEIENIELLDLLRIFDRVAGPVGGKAGIQVSGDLNVNQYDTLIQALLAPNSGAQSTNFPIYEADGVSIPGQDPPE